jgi:hypothetical protein
MLVNELVTSLFDGVPSLLAEAMAEWLASSRRFSSFVTTHQTKIRKKVRSAQDPESLRDLMLELETAYLLLRERSLSLAYEPQHRELGRSPDFAVSFTTSSTFMVEVTRMRLAQQRTSSGARQANGGAQPPPGESITPLPANRLAELICSKLGQFLPQRSNVLVVGMESPELSQSDLQAVMLRIQQRAEVSDPTILQRYAFRDRADFFRHYQRLSAILLRAIPLRVGTAAGLWVNPQAKHALPARVKTAIVRSHTL